MAKLRCQYFVALFLLFGLVAKVACEKTQGIAPVCLPECNANKCLGAISSGCPQPCECKNVGTKSLCHTCRTLLCDCSKSIPCCTGFRCLDMMSNSTALSSSNGVCKK